MEKSVGTNHVTSDWMSPLFLQILLYASGLVLIIMAMRYASRPLVHALWHRKMNELPKIDAAIARAEELKPAPDRHELPRVAVPAKIERPVSAVARERKEPTIRPGLLTKTEKVHFIS
jgi:hypothetical protein